MQKGSKHKPESKAKISKSKTLLPEVRKLHGTDEHLPKSDDLPDIMEEWDKALARGTPRSPSENAPPEAWEKWREDYHVFKESFFGREYITFSRWVSAHNDTSLSSKSHVLNQSSIDQGCPLGWMINYNKHWKEDWEQTDRSEEYRSCREFTSERPELIERLKQYELDHHDKNYGKEYTVSNKLHYQEVIKGVVPKEWEVEVLKPYRKEGD